MANESYASLGAIPEGTESLGNVVLPAEELPMIIDLCRPRLPVAAARSERLLAARAAVELEIGFLVPALRAFH